ncbi:hypothetical protein [Mycobacterium sp.]|uniref:hypothetical protein n=1 Tax=Mycobacterium sp. TaxID=1785 RepID=UPI003F9C1ED3
MTTTTATTTTAANRDEINRRNRERYRANPDEINRRQREYYEANRDEILRRSRAAYPRRSSRVREVRAALDTSRSGSPWTPAETRIALREDLLCVEAAALLRRSPQAVSSHRSQVRRTRRAAKEADAKGLEQ